MGDDVALLVAYQFLFAFRLLWCGGELLPHALAAGMPGLVGNRRTGRPRGWGPLDRIRR
jgi:hypothetical protein